MFETDAWPQPSVKTEFTIEDDSHDFMSARSVALLGKLR